MEWIPGATLISKGELRPKTMTRIDEQLKREHEELLWELGIIGLKNSGSRDTVSTFRYPIVCCMASWKFSKEGKIIMEDGNYRNMGQGDHLVGML